MPVYFQYGEKEIAYLKKKDKKLAAVIDRIGMIERAVNPDLFSALVHSITGQQISTKAHQAVWQRMLDSLETITPEVINQLSLEEIQAFGMTFRKAGYIQSAAQKIIDKEFNINALHDLSDQEVCEKLTELKGVGQWTAEMLMIFSMQRMNILSYGDLAIQRGLRMIYHHQEINREKFNQYWKRYTPYASVASLYIWAVSSGAIPEMKDYEPQKTK